MSADHASQKLLEWLDDPEVPYRVRAEIAQDLLDRAGFAPAQLHKIVPMDADPVIAFFDGLLNDPSNWVENPPQPAIEERVIDLRSSRKRSSRLRFSNQPTTRHPEWQR
jgi:hypothetical protein